MPNPPCFPAGPAGRRYARDSQTPRGASGWPDAPSPLPFYESLERELLDRLNALGIGPQGFGGRTTALAVHIETMPTHIAGLPCAVNINCHVARHATEVL